VLGLPIGPELICILGHLLRNHFEDVVWRHVTLLHFDEVDRLQLLLDQEDLERRVGRVHAFADGLELVVQAHLGLILLVKLKG